MKHQIAFAAALLAMFVTSSGGQDAASPQLPRITLSLPAGVRSETAQITYFMGGAFGGVGGYVKSEKGKHSYEIDASSEGKPAAMIKFIVYFPGCEIATITLQLSGDESQKLVCKPLESISLHGQVFPVSITQEQSAVIDVTYSAEWSLRFFGINDGFPTVLQIGTVTPDENGEFDVKLPDFDKQRDLGEGAFGFTLRNGTTGNIIASLKPADTSKNLYGLLKVRSSYAPIEQFVAENR